MRSAHKKLFNFFLSLVMVLQPVAFSYAMTTMPHTTGHASGVMSTEYGHNNHMQSQSGFACSSATTHHQTDVDYHTCGNVTCCGVLPINSSSSGIEPIIYSNYQRYTPDLWGVTLPKEIKPPIY